MFENLPKVGEEDFKFYEEELFPNLVGGVNSGFREDLENRLLDDLNKTNLRLAATVWGGLTMVVESLKADTFGELPDDVYWEMGWNVAVAELAVLGLIDHALGRQQANRH